MSVIIFYKEQLRLLSVPEWGGIQKLCSEIQKNSFPMAKNFWMNEIIQSHDVS